MNASDTSVLKPQASALPQQNDNANAARVETTTVHATHNAVKAEDLSVFIGAKCLLANAELKIAEQCHNASAIAAAPGAKAKQSGACYGLVGVNGCGKSTLLQLIADRHLPVPPSWDVFLVSQHLTTPQKHCPVEEVLRADSKRLLLLQELESLEEQLRNVSGSVFEDTNARLLELHSELHKWDGAEKDITDILLALGFRRPGHCLGGECSEPMITTPMDVLSGGWRMKVQLAKALWLQPKLLLLDEPTNHLDFQAMRWLEDRLEQYPHTIVVVSHDVSFLHGVCREILWMKDLRVEALPRDMVSQEDLLRMQRRRALNFTFKTPENDNAEDHGLSLHAVEFQYERGNASSSGPSRLQVKKEVRFSGRSRSVLLGRNGTGKSTFLNLCAGKLCPTKGSVDRTPDIKIGHYSQLTDELDNNSTESAASYLVHECREELALHAGSTRSVRLRSALSSRARKNDQPPSRSDAQPAMTAKAATQQKRLLEIARGVLSNFGFDGDAAINVPVDRLSGGQKALLKFAVLSLRPVHILLLDEPTNHLDAEACEALARGLSEFQGGIVAVTHDELLIYRLINCNWSASELLVCRGGSIWRERNFGAHCLNALKQEVHRAEEKEASGGNQQHYQTSVTESHSGELAQDAGDAKKELPPWMQRRKRNKEKLDQPVDVAAGTLVTANAIGVNSTETPEATMHHRALLRDEAVAQRSHIRTFEKLAANASTPEKVQQCCVGVLNTWEDAVDSDATTNAPEEEEPFAGTEKIEAPEQLDSPRTVCIASDPSPYHELKEMNRSASQLDQVSSLCERPGKALIEAERKPGRHSRLRKDIVNLNKAVKKWLKQEADREIEHHEVVERISKSLVARQLQSLHGDKFDQGRFIKDVLQHASNNRASQLD